MEELYRYLVKRIIKYFSDNDMPKGSRYYFVEDEAPRRNALIDVIREEAKELTIRDVITPGDSYQTYAIDIEDKDYNLIFCVDGEELGKMTSAYQTTLRNKFAEKPELCDNILIYVVLSETKGSIISAAYNLASVGRPLNTDVLAEGLKDRVQTQIQSEKEKVYLTEYLNTKKEEELVLNDIAGVLTILGYDENATNRTLTGHYNQINCFEDDDEDSDSDWKVCFKDNNKRFLAISKIMDYDDEDDVENALSSLYDKNVANTLLEKWKDRANNGSDVINYTGITYTLLIDSSEKLNKRNSLLFKGYDCAQNIVCGKDGKTTHHVILTGNFDLTPTDLTLSFSNPIDEVKGIDYRKSGNSVAITLNNDLKHFSVSRGSNRHEFFIRRLSLDKESIEKTIVGKFKWKSTDSILTIDTKQIIDLFGLNINPEDEDGDVEETVNIGGISQKIIFKIDAKPATNILAGKITRSVFFDGISFSFEDFCAPVNAVKSSDGNHDGTLSQKLRPFLEIEKRMIEERALYIKADNTVEQINHTNPLVSPLILQSLEAIYNYFERNNTTPTLRVVDDELMQLYKNYLDIFKRCENTIDTNRQIVPTEYYLTRLGVIEREDGNVWLSPFHPLIIAYTLELQSHINVIEEKETDNNSLLKLLYTSDSLPIYPYNNEYLEPYTESDANGLFTWLFYQKQEKKNSSYLTADIVQEKINLFIKHNKHLFLDSESPIILHFIGIGDDRTIVLGLIKYIKEHFNDSIPVQKIEIHFYTDDFRHESFFEKLNRINNIERIINELGNEVSNINIDLIGEIVHLLFTRVDFYKHESANIEASIKYSHITFYHMNMNTQYSCAIVDNAKQESACEGLYGLPSIVANNNNYVVCSCNSGDNTQGNVYPISNALNSLYANSSGVINMPRSNYNREQVVIKNLTISQNEEDLVNSIYDNSNWIVYVNPEVDSSYFYNNTEKTVLYLDPISIGARYSSVTLTNSTERYNTLINDSYSAPDNNSIPFTNAIMKMFNCIDTDWLQDLPLKNEKEVTKIVSKVAFAIDMQTILSARINEVLWIPSSLSCLLRIMDAIGIDKNILFPPTGRKKLAIDDILMMGLDLSDIDNPKMRLYPTTIAFSDTDNAKAIERIVYIINCFHHLFIDPSSAFSKDIFTTFFAAQFLSIVEKLKSQKIGISETTYQRIQDFRYKLLNLQVPIVIDTTFSMGMGFALNVAGNHSIIMLDVKKGVPIANTTMTNPEIMQIICNEQVPVFTDLTNSNLIHTQDYKNWNNAINNNG